MAAALMYETVTGLETVAPAPRPGAATPSDDIIGDNGLIDDQGDQIIGDNGLLNEPGGPGGPPPYNPPKKQPD
jgi:hypothetical protein